MPQTKHLPVSALSLDLLNFRTVRQSSEAHAVQAIIAINAEWFWALMESLVEDGYHPTENIIVFDDGKSLIVKEGNRRIGILKLLLGLLKDKAIEIPATLKPRVSALTNDWKKTNASVPCAIYKLSEIDVVEKIVAITHAKGEKAGRDKWNAVARARHNRDKKAALEPGLDLLEKYLKVGKNLDEEERLRWGGDFHLSVLDEAIQKIAPRLGLQSAKLLSDQYPKIKESAVLDEILRDIGRGIFGFNDIRGVDSLSEEYGIPALPSQAGSATNGTATSARTGSSTASGASTASRRKSASYSCADPKYVLGILKKFKPRGKNRGKVVDLLDEMKRLKLEKHPYSFCFLLRSLFEISAKLYCDDNQAAGLTAKEKNGNDRKLVEVLRDITKHLTNNMADKTKVKALHGAMTELAKSDGVLSVTSLNQLVHNPKFSIIPSDICIVFGNVFPLLEAMNS